MSSVVSCISLCERMEMGAKNMYVCECVCVHVCMRVSVCICVYMEMDWL